MDTKKDKFSPLNDIEGLQFIPLNSDKEPIVKGWRTHSGKHDLSRGVAVGLLCGKLSNNLEAIDVDVKYDLTGDLYESYKKIVHAMDKNILLKMVVAKTRSKGFHWIYRCSEIAGNAKLANRPSTEEERKQTWKERYESELAAGSDDEKARKEADVESDRDKVRVLIETRGEGGYIVSAPSEGYEIIHGDLMSITEITPAERETLWNAARQLNEVFEEYRPPKYKQEKSAGLSPFDDYNDRGDVVKLLTDNGWKFVHQRGAKYHFLRAGNTKTKTSGNYDENRNWFTVFSTSTEFKTQTAYLPYAVFAILECGGNFEEAVRKLYDLGYGDRRKEKEKAPSTRVIQSRIDPNADDYSFLATPKDYDNYLRQVRDGTLPQGLTTGSPQLDKHFMFKEGAFVNMNGIDNTGKSVWVWWLKLIAAMYHGWGGIIFSSENTIGGFMRKMIQFYWGKPLYSTNGLVQVINDQEYAQAKEFIEKHFLIIKAQEELFNYKDVLNMIKLARKKYSGSRNLRYALIDPYNSLKIDLSGFSKLSTHEFHYEALSEMKAYGQQTNFGFWINHHAVTQAARTKDAEKKYPAPPHKADTEGGQKVANKADDFLTAHRITQHPSEWMITDIHIRKIKDTETGGKPTPIDKPVRFEMYRHGCGFIEKIDLAESTDRPVDPILEWRKKQEKTQGGLFVGSGYVEPEVKEIPTDLPF